MKRLFTIFLCLFITSTVTFSQEYAPGDEVMIVAQKKAEMWGRVFEKDLKYSIGNNYDLKYYRFFWEVDPAVLYINGKVTSHFEITVDNTQLIQFELADNMTVDSIKYHGNHATFTHSSKTIEIDLGVQIASGVLDSVTIWYQGAPTSSGGFGSFIISTHNTVPILWTLSEPYGASDWWPCKNVLKDKADSIDVFVKTPSQYRAASNGLLVDEQSDGTHTVYHWKHRYPIETYLVAIAVTNYAVYSDYVMLSTGLLETLNYVFPEDSATAVTETPRVNPCLVLFDSLAGPYPFASEKYGHAQFGWGGGMEHQTMSFMGSFSHELIAHELAHMWFGDAITCGSWQDIWINEGFATYYTGLSYEHLFGEVDWMTWKQNRINNITSEPWGSVWCDDTTNVWRIFSGRLSYNKGAYLLHMLRWVMGDYAFYDAILNYIQDPSLRYGYARTSDFVEHAEATHGSDLTWFFDQWFYGQGYPSYNIHAEKHSSGEIHMYVSQTQSHASVSYFQMPLPIRFSNGTKDTTVVLNNTYNNQEFVIDMSFDPLQISFDPELWILSNNNTTSMSIQEHDTAISLNVSPNPATDFITINAQNINFSKISIYDLTGKLAIEYEFPQTTQSTISVETLPKGTYMMHIEGSEVFYNVKIIIQ